MSPRLAGSHTGRRPPEIALTIPEAATAARALDAAIALMYSHLAVPCPEGPCARHAADMETARAYRELRAVLVEVDPGPRQAQHLVAPQPAVRGQAEQREQPLARDKVEEAPRVGG